MIEHKVVFTDKKALDDPSNLAAHITFETEDKEACLKCAVFTIAMADSLPIAREGHTVRVEGVCDNTRRRISGCGFGGVVALSVPHLRVIQR